MTSIQFLRVYTANVLEAQQNQELLDSPHKWIRLAHEPLEKDPHGMKPDRKLDAALVRTTTAKTLLKDSAKLSRCNILSQIEFTISEVPTAHVAEKENNTPGKAVGKAQTKSPAETASSEQVSTVKTGNKRRKV